MITISNRANIKLNKTGNTSFYSYGGRPQRSIFRDPDTRLQFPHFQRQVADVIQVPPKMYGAYTPKCSLDLVI